MALAICICILGTFATVSILARGSTNRRFSVQRYFQTAATFGFSVWSLHFIAMLAFVSEQPIAYDITTTIESIAVAVAGSLAGLIIWRGQSSYWSVIAGGTVLALAIFAMHYTGVAAMRPSVTMTVNLDLVAVSAAIAIVFAVTALARARNLTSPARRIEVSGWLGLSICSVHFIGMAALDISPGSVTRSSGILLGTVAMAVIVASVSIATLVITLAATVMEQIWGKREAQESHRMRRLANLAPEAMLICRNDLVLEINAAGCRLFGVASDTVLGQPVSCLFAAGYMPVVMDGVHPGIEGLQPRAIELKTAAGRSIHVEISCETINFQGYPATGYALRDMSEHRLDKKRIHHLSHHDALTDLPNHVLLHQQLTHTLEEAAWSGASVAVIEFDLERFKSLYNVFGTAGSDAVLLQVAKRLRTVLQPTDILARVADDEFVVVRANHQMPDQAAELAAQLAAALAQQFEFEQHLLALGTSIGIAFYPRDGVTPDALLRAAHTAMRNAKQDARGLSYFEPSLDTAFTQRRDLEQDLRHALARDEMELFYQPVMNCRNNEIEGYEALIRWRHPINGLVAPGEFIPLAEELGIISQLGNWAINTACDMAASWTIPRWVAVNVSPRQFRHSDIPAVVVQALKRTGLAPGQLEIEITEGVFIDDAPRAVSVLQGLHALGVRVVLDDFGTGYSSLSYLRLFKFDKIKIDQSFVPELGHSEDAMTIVKAILNLGHNLGISVTVEGVETPLQLSIIEDLGADYVQGYLLGHPAQMTALVDIKPALAAHRPTQDLQSHLGIRWAKQTR